MRVAATYTTKTYIRPYPLQERIAETLHHIKATASKANLVKVTFDGIIVVAVVFPGLICRSEIQRTKNRSILH